jgi:hypothetical protein
MTIFTGGDAIRAFLADLDGWLSDSVDVYLLGGSAMTIEGLKDQTEDIDLALAVDTEFEHVFEALRRQGFAIADEPTVSFEGVGTTVELYQSTRDMRVDLFDRQIVGKVSISDRMCDRANEFWSGTHASAFVLSDEDMFLLKAVSGGDLASARRRDIEDMRIYAQRGLDYDVVLDEIESQRPFNMGSAEAQQIRDGSHPLFTIETAVTSLTGLPTRFTDRVTALATEFEIEHAILNATDDGLTDRKSIHDAAVATVRALSDDQREAVDAGIERLVRKRVLDSDGDTVRQR